MNDKRLDEYKKRLIEMQRELLENIIDETTDEENPFDVDGDLADKAEIFSSVAISEGLSTTQKNTLEKIRKALQKIKSGDYGKCQVCGKDIEPERLKAVPYAETCKEHMNNRHG
jgi:DnaK suppressor protein